MGNQQVTLTYVFDSGRTESKTYQLGTEEYNAELLKVVERSNKDYPNANSAPMYKIAENDDYLEHSRLTQDEIDEIKGVRKDTNSFYVGTDDLVKEQQHTNVGLENQLITDSNGTVGSELIYLQSIDKNLELIKSDLLAEEINGKYGPNKIADLEQLRPVNNNFTQTFNVHTTEVVDVKALANEVKRVINEDLVTAQSTSGAALRVVKLR